MGSVFKKTVTRPLPQGAEFIVRQGVRLARWRDGKGKIRTAPVTTGRDGTERIRDESSTYFARHRDGNGIVVETPTGCRDESAARQVLADLERRAERVRSGLLTSAEDRIAEHQITPIGEHVDGFAASLEASGATAKHVRETRRILGRIFNGCDFHTLGDLERSAVEYWLNTRRSEGASARTRNVDLAALIAFGNWCVANRRLILNPFRGIPKANEAADPRRRRRAMTEDELVRLLEVARRRPLLDALTVHTGKRKGEAFANIRPEVRERLEALGRERALIYKTLVLTGLRKHELATLAVAQLRLDGPVPHVELDAADDKEPGGQRRRNPGRPGGRPQALARRQARHAPGGSPPARRANLGRASIRYPHFRRAGRAGADLRPRPEARRDPEARRAGPHPRRACTQDDLRHSPEPGQGAFADGPSRDEAFRPEPQRPTSTPTPGCST